MSDLTGILVRTAFKCPLALCPKTFAVRSNARRHLRTHGITIPPPSARSGRTHDEGFRVGFETPVVIDVHDPASPFLTEEAGQSVRHDEIPSEDGSSSLKRGDAKGKKATFRWIPQSLAQRSNADRLRSISPGSDMADIDAELGPLPSAHASAADSSSAPGSGTPAARDGDVVYPAFEFSHPHDIARFEPPNFQNEPAEDAKPLHLSQTPRQGLEYRSTVDRASLRVAPAPLPPAIPTDESGASDLHTRFEERNSLAEAGTHPYHPDQVSVSSDRRSSTTA